jgi:hypothetical protein
LVFIFTSILVRSGDAFVDTLKLKIVKQHRESPDNRGIFVTRYPRRNRKEKQGGYGEIKYGTKSFNTGIRRQLSPGGRTAIFW